MSERTELLFAYGTLQRPAIQHEWLGRELAGVPDGVAGFRAERIAIDDPAEAAVNGAAFYPALVADPHAAELITGTCYALSPDDLARADLYEGKEYARRQVTLASGKTAWLYVAAQTEVAR